MRLLSSGGVRRDMHELQFEPVGVVEEHGVVTRQVTVRLRAALDLHLVGAQPLGALVDRAARRRLEGDVMQADAVAVVWAVAGRRRLPQAERAARGAEVVDRLAALALDLAEAVPPERAQQLAVERQAALDRGDDDVEMVEAARAHDACSRGSAVVRQFLSAPVADGARRHLRVDALLDQLLTELALRTPAQEQPGD